MGAFFAIWWVFRGYRGYFTYSRAQRTEKRCPRVAILGQIPTEPWVHVASTRKTPRGTTSGAQHGDGVCLRRAGASFCILLSTMEQNDAGDDDIRTQEPAETGPSTAWPTVEADAEGAEAGPARPASKGKRRRRWNEADDSLAMKAGVSASSHKAPCGMRTKRFAAAAESYNSHPQATNKTDGKHLRDRYFLLKEIFGYEDKRKPLKPGPNAPSPSWTTCSSA